MERYLDLLIRVMTCFGEKKVYRKSMEYAKKYVATDPYDEKIYRLGWDYDDEFQFI